jgi:PhnB protein
MTSPTLLAPYLSFPGQARAAMEHYREVLGGELTIDTFAGSGLPHPPAKADLVRHAQLTTSSGMTLMACDVDPADAPTGGAVSLALSGSDREQLTACWTALSAGGTVQMPLAEAPWGAVFGMCVDRFGVSWMVNISR